MLVKKIIPYFLITIIISGIGFFSGAEKASAADGLCSVDITTIRVRMVGGTEEVTETTSQIQRTLADTVCKLANPDLRKVLGLDGDQSITNVEWQPLSVADKKMWCIVRDTTRSVQDGQVVKQLKDVEERNCNYERLKGLYPDLKPEPTFRYTPASTLSPDLIKTGGGVAVAEDIFENIVKGKACIDLSEGFDMMGCALKFTYFVLYMPMAGVLWLSAKFFDYLIFVTLSSTLFREGFVREAWAIVRDLSNLFFILILLYVAIEIILGLAHDAKKAIVRVIVAALLINFSMFFTGIAIDSSNILALVFYNKLQTTYKDKNGEPVERSGDTPVGAARDVSGSLADSFNLTKMVTPKIIKATSVPLPGGLKSSDPSSSLMLVILLVAIAVMGLASYAFLVAGFSFVGRLVELWVLIIASPFAFMSSTIHELEGIKDWGWHSWLHRLLTASFMAPAFMFFLYFIFKLSEAGVKDMLQPTKDSGESLILLLLSFVLPALLIMILLLKSVSLAKASAGQMGETVAKWGEKLGGMAGGLALGAATGGAGLALGGAAALGRNTAGRTAAALAESNKFKTWAADSKLGKRAMNLTSGLASSSFDLRGVKLGGKGLSSVSGLKGIGKGQEGGFVKARAEAVKKEEEFANKVLDTGDYAKAEMSRGGMSQAKADKLIKTMIDGGMTDLGDVNKYRTALMGNGVRKENLGEVSRYLNTSRRNTYADRLEKRAKNWQSKAGTWFASKNIAANKIRKDSHQQKEEEELAHVIHKVVEEAEKGHGKGHGKKHDAEEETTEPAHPTPPQDGGGSAPTPHPHA
ncbi:MAG: hypothetical protein WCT29_02875 [Candidatus Paceibacterota bacterium]